MCNLIKSKYLNPAVARKAEFNRESRQHHSHRGSVDIPEHHLSRSSLGILANSRTIKDDLNSDTSSLNEDYICEEKISSFSPQSFSKPRASSNSALPTFPTVITAPMYNNMYAYCKQLYYPSQQNVQLPASFEYTNSCFENEMIKLLFHKLISSSPDSDQFNFFISFVILWFLSSPSIRNLIRKGKRELDTNSTSQQSPMIAPAADPTSLSPSIQSMCTILNVTPQIGCVKTELDILSELLPEIEGILEKKELLRISSVSLRISEEFVKNNLLSNYQQFGISFFTYDPMRPSSCTARRILLTTF